jgi:probable phosphoglycerate mutase
MGIRLAREVAGAETTFKGCVSPLGRAQQTVTRITQFVPVKFSHEPRLMEVTMGSWDGMSHYEIDVEYPGALKGSNAFDWYFRSPDGETFDDACKRVAAWLSQVSSPTIAVSHGLTSRLVRGVYLGMSQREMLELPVPQNGFYRLSDGRSDFIE